VYEVLLMSCKNKREKSIIGFDIHLLQKQSIVSKLIAMERSYCIQTELFIIVSVK
jgi:hypothetical protein